MHTNIAYNKWHRMASADFDVNLFCKCTILHEQRKYKYTNNLISFRLSPFLVELYFLVRVFFSDFISCFHHIKSCLLCHVCVFGLYIQTIHKCGNHIVITIMAIFEYFNQIFMDFFMVLPTKLLFQIMQNKSSIDRSEMFTEAAFSGISSFIIFTKTNGSHSKKLPIACS